ncbi:MAG: TonB-dependent receptor [Bryobacteraceae bacterium]|nr:TonB-dependent receptor [Bryobacteraceae bacterium]
MRIIAQALLAITLASPLAAQFQRGTILGSITDPTGAVISGVKVTLRNLETNEERRSTSSERGDYEFLLLLPGNYRVTAETNGFRTQVVNDVKLEVNQTARIDMSLLVGDVSQQVEAVASLKLLQTDTAEIGAVITNKQIVELPLNGRDYLQLARLVPGAIPSRAGATAGQKGVSRSVNVAGARDTSVAFLLDGIDTNDIVFQTPSVTPSVDAIQEFKLLANAYSAEFGRGSTQVIAALKSGSNQVHSTLFAFNRNSALAARNFFQPGAVAFLNFNQFGGTLGGPVMVPKLYSGKNRTFFFVNFEANKTRSGGAGFAFVPDPALRTGDFSGGTRAIYDPTTFDAASRTRLQFPGNRIPASRINPIAPRVLALYPTANFTGQAGRNYAVNVPGIDDSDNGNARVDHKISDRDNVFVRYSILDRTRPQPAPLQYNGTRDDIRGQNVALNWVHIFSPSVINEVRAGFNRAKYYTVPIDSPSANPAKDLFNFQNTIADPTVGYGLPAFSFQDGFSTIGPGTQFPANSVTQTYQYVDNLTIVRGAQTFKMGFDLRRTRLTAIVGNSARGSVSFTGQFTNSPSAASTTGSSIADLLLGSPQAIASSVGDGVAHDYTNLYSFYFQDDWKLTNRLTVNLGLRYEYASPFVEKLDRFTILDTNDRASGGRLLLANSTKAFQPGRGIIDSGVNATRSLIPRDRNNVAPRVGMAYRPFSKTVIRSGAGFFFDVQEANEAQFLRNNPPYLFAQNLASDPFVPTFRLDNLFPSPTGASTTGTIGAIQPFSVDLTNRTPYVAQWNVAVERELMNNLVLEVGYVGSAGKKLLRRSNFQQGSNILVRDPRNPTPLAQRVDFPNFSNNYIVGTDNGASSSYHGLLTKVERRFANGFSVLFSYTWSHAISDAASSSNFDNTPSNPQCRCDFRAEKGPAAFDIRHRAVVSYAYELPFGKGKALLSQGAVLNKLVGGWQVNGISAWQTGAPFTLNTPGDNAAIGSSAQRPNLVGDPAAGISGSIQQRGVDPGSYYFNRAAFAVPPQFTLGNLGKNTLIAPGFQNWDFSVFKNTALAEKVNLQLRGEFFNIFNKANFGVPGRTLNQPTYGVITSAAAPRLVQIGLKLIF